MNIPKTITRKDYLAMTPDKYLKEGFFDIKGKLRPEMRGVYATAGAIQMEEFRVPPQELRVYWEALKESVGGQEGSPAEKFRVAYFDAFETTFAILKKKADAHFIGWMTTCVDFVKTENDIKAFLDHLLAVVKQHAIFTALKVRSAP